MVVNIKFLNYYQEMPNNKYLNAINILAFAKIGALQSIHETFDGAAAATVGTGWEKAWHSNLAKFLPNDALDKKRSMLIKNGKRLRKRIFNSSLF